MDSHARFIRCNSEITSSYEAALVGLHFPTRGSQMLMYQKFRQSDMGMIHLSSGFAVVLFLRFHIIGAAAGVWTWPDEVFKHPVPHLWLL
jgi:hypothetical protein